MMIIIKSGRWKQHVSPAATGSEAGTGGHLGVPKQAGRVRHAGSTVLITTIEIITIISMPLLPCFQVVVLFGGG